jgi:hypothetical protein
MKFADRDGEGHIIVVAQALNYPSSPIKIALLHNGSCFVEQSRTTTAIHKSFNHSVLSLIALFLVFPMTLVISLSVLIRK